MTLNKITKRNAHLLLNGRRIHDVAAYAEEFCAAIALAAKACEPCATTAAYCRRNSDRFDVCDGRWTAKNANICLKAKTRSFSVCTQNLEYKIEISQTYRKWWLEARLKTFANSFDV